MKNPNKYNVTNTVSGFVAYVSTFMLRHNLTRERVAQWFKDTRDGISARYNLAVSLCVAFVTMLRSETALALNHVAALISPDATLVTADVPAWERPEGGFETLTLSNGTTFGVWFPPAEVPEYPCPAPPPALEDEVKILPHDETPALVITFNENVASELQERFSAETTDSPSDPVETPQTSAQSEEKGMYAPPDAVAHVRKERVSKDKRRIDYKPAKDVTPGASYWYKLDGKWQERLAPPVVCLAA